MYLGRIVERGTVDEVLGAPQHPYTQALLAAVPTIDGERRAALRQGRAAVAVGAAGRLSLPPALPARDGALQAGVPGRGAALADARGGLLPRRGSAEELTGLSSGRRGRTRDLRGRGGPRRRGLGRRAAGGGLGLLRDRLLRALRDGLLRPHLDDQPLAGNELCAFVHALQVGDRDAERGGDAAPRVALLDHVARGPRRAGRRERQRLRRRPTSPSAAGRAAVRRPPFPSARGR